MTVQQIRDFDEGKNEAHPDEEERRPVDGEHVKKEENRAPGRSFPSSGPWAASLPHHRATVDSSTGTPPTAAPPSARP